MMERKGETLTHVWRARRPLNILGADQLHHLPVRSQIEQEHKVDVHTTGRTLGRGLHHRAGMMISRRHCLPLCVTHGRRSHRTRISTRVWSKQVDRSDRLLWMLQLLHARPQSRNIVFQRQRPRTTWTVGVFTVFDAFTPETGRTDGSGAVAFLKRQGR
jgi:hypothetical protein